MIRQLLPQSRTLRRNCCITARPFRVTLQPVRIQNMALLRRYQQMRYNSSTKHEVDETINVVKKKTGRSFWKIVYISFASLGAGVTTVGVLLGAFFIYDATTYKDLDDTEDCEVAQIALHPKKGGPKDLPIVERFLGDEDTPEEKSQLDKPRLVVLGSGWGVRCLFNMKSSL